AVDNHSLRCWDVASGKKLWQNDSWVSHVIVSPDGTTLCADTYLGGPLHLFDAAAGDHLAALTRPGPGRVWTIHLSFSPDGQLLAQGTSQEVVLWDVKGRLARHCFEGAGPCVAFTPDGRSLVTLGPLLGRWDVDTGKSLYPDVRDRGHVGR